MAEVVDRIELVKAAERCLQAGLGLGDDRHGRALMKLACVYLVRAEGVRGERLGSSPALQRAMGGR